MKKNAFPLKSFFLFQLLFLIVINTCAQSKKKDNVYWISADMNLFAVLQNVEVSSISSNPFSTYKSSFYQEKVSSINIGLGFKKINDGFWFQEYSLVAMDMRRDDDVSIMVPQEFSHAEPHYGRLKNSFNLYLRWEYGKLFKFRENQVLLPGIGLSVDPFTHFSKIVPKTSMGYPLTYLKIGAEVRLIPRIEFVLKEKLRLHIKIPVGINSLFWEQSSVENPILSEKERNTNTLNNEIGLGHFQACIGLSYKIGK